MHQTRHKATENRGAADALFYIQVIGAAGLVIPMLIRNLYTVEGVSMSFLIVLLVFCGLQASLALPAHRTQPSRKTRQALFIYMMWIVLVGVDILIIWLGGLYEWDTNDSVTIGATLVGAVLVYRRRRSRGFTFENPITKSQVAMTTRGIPQLLQGVKIFIAGGGGLPGVSVLVGNLNIWIRMAHLILTQQEAIWDENRRWLLASELVNALTWGMVSIVWLSWYFGWI